MFAKMFQAYQQWSRAREARRLQERTARAADLVDRQPYDLLFLHERGFVRATGTGQSITQIYGEVRNLIDRKLEVVIKPGTYFEARGNFQNMVTRREYRFTLFPTATQNVAIEASCINAGRPIPTKKDRFAGVRSVSPDVVRFLEAAQGKDPMVIQAGVWSLTDGYSGEDVKNHLVLVDPQGNRRRAVSDHHIEEARAIFAALGMRSPL